MQWPDFRAVALRLAALLLGAVMLVLLDVGLLDGPIRDQLAQELCAL